MHKNIAITVIVSVKNEEINLPNCLEKLKYFSQVIVVDSMSTDKTPEIVNSYGYQLINFEWNGKFPKKRNWTIRNVNLNNEWLLFLDADEIITLDFINEITSKIQETNHVGFWLNFNNYFMGKKLKYGDKMRKLAFFKKGFGEYEKIEEDTWSHLDMEIHEHPILKGTVGEINSPIEHNDYKGLEHYVAKHNAYSSWEANRFFSIKKNKKHLTKRQRFKYKMLSSGFLPLIYFFYSYFVKFGFLDGKPGLYLAKYKANYFFQIQTKIKELKNKN